ncbi:MAG: DUF2190 family protein [Campylobacterales bacterium]|nr:DUF2190 family protein [Campylobacterales bacterium]
MSKRTLVLTFVAGAAIAANTLVKFGSADGEVAQAAAATDGVIGISELGAEGAGDRVDVTLAGIEEVTYGGTVTRGDLLTTDANGRAISATVAGSRIIGYALESGVAGDIVGVMIAPSQI